MKKAIWGSGIAALFDLYKQGRFATNMERLQEIYNCIEKSGVVADIGCDHGKLEGMLILSGRAQRVIASDISAKSLKKAVKSCAKAEYEGKVSFRQGDGLSVFAAGEADVIVIAGIGGLQIADILKKGENVAQPANLVLCPHSHEAKLRKYLLENGYKIQKESLALEEGRYYQIICAKFDGKKRAESDSFYYEVGRTLLESNNIFLRDFLKCRMMKIKEIMQSAARSENPNAEKRVKELSAFLEKMEEYLK